MKTRSIKLPKRSERWFAFNPEIGVVWEANGATECEVRVAVRRLFYTGGAQPWSEIAAEGWSEVLMDCSPSKHTQRLKLKGGKTLYMGTLWPHSDLDDHGRPEKS